MTWLEQKGDDILIHLKATPFAKKVGVSLETDLFSEIHLRVAVSAPAEDGLANKAVIEILSKLWKIPKTQFTLVRGQTAREKTLCLKNHNDYYAKLQMWQEQHLK